MFLGEKLHMQHIFSTLKISQFSFSFSYLTSNITKLTKTRKLEELITERNRSAQPCIMYVSARSDLSLVHQTTCAQFRSCAASILHVTLTYIFHYPPYTELEAASHGETMQERLKHDVDLSLKELRPEY